MAEYEQSSVKVEEGSTVEATDRGLFGFGGKKEEDKKPHEEAISTEFDEKVQVSEHEEKKHGGLLEKLHRSNSSSSSSSDEEEVEEGGEKKKKKKGLKGKIKEKVSGDKKEEEKTENKHEEDTSIPVEKYDDPALAETVSEPEEKKGFLDKIKEKLPGGQKKTEEVTAPSPPAVVEYNTPTATATATATEGDQVKEKKGFLDKIKEKLPGYHPKSTEEEKEKEKEKEKEEGASHY